MNLDLQKGSRSRVLAIVLLAIAAIFVLRLFYLQVIRHDYYKDLARQEQVKELTIPASRGLIYALDGSTPVQMVLNQTVYTVFADPSVVTQPNKVIDAIHTIAGGNAKDNLSGLLAIPGSRYEVLGTKLSRDQADQLKALNLSGLGFQAVTQRVYPEGSLAAQVLGFVGADGTGQYGIEQGMNSQLKGTDGLLKSVTDVADVPLTLGDDNIDTPAKNGTNVVMSIDRNVQTEAEQALASGIQKVGATNGSVIVMNPQNGQVMAMANLPSFDPSQYNLVTDPSDFNNGVVSDPYEPGSDIKTFTMSTGIDKGVVKATDTYNNTGHIDVDGTTINNATLSASLTGNITFQTALNWSLNTGFVTVAERLGDGTNINLQARTTMYDYFYNRFKLGQLTGIQLGNEQAGTIIPPTDPDGNAVRYSNMAFGQGMDVTMLQVAAGFSSIINGGHYYTPTILAGTIDDNGVYNPAAAAKSTSSPIAQSTSDQIRDMTHTARQYTFPTADTPGFYVGGKTGTSQVIENGIYSPTDSIGTYLGYGGTASASNYVIMVQVSAKGKAFGGAQDAEPIFAQISNWLLNYLKIPPEGQ